MLRSMLPAAAGAAILSFCPALAQPRDGARHIPPLKAPGLRPSTPRAGFRFVETKPSDLRIGGYTLTLTDGPIEARASLIYPEPLHLGPLATALTPLQFPDPRAAWLPRCLQTREAPGPETALSISPDSPVRAGAGPSLIGIAAAR